MNDLRIEPGKYIVAVSGGVDSMVLLNMAFEQLGADALIVAYYDHRVRSEVESAQDKQLIVDYCDKRSIPLAVGEYAGDKHDEASLRQARYAFLRAQKTNEFKTILLAHHQDDLIETAIINMLRGTGGKGLIALSDRADISRPLLPATKDDIKTYAQTNEIAWHEDSTNADETYLRNYVRRKIVPLLQKNGVYEELVQRVLKQKDIELATETSLQEIEELESLFVSDNSIDRKAFILLPHVVARKILHHWFTTHANLEVDKRRVDKAVVFAKTAKLGSSIDVSKDTMLRTDHSLLELVVKH
jgi:tRNA(Ile)-lysidine synthase